MTKTVRYSSRFSMVFQPSERSMLQQLAEGAGVHESQWVRQMVRREFAARGAASVVAPGEPVKKSAGRPKRVLGAT